MTFLDILNIATLYIHDDQRTASEAYRRYCERKKAAGKVWALASNKAAKERVKAKQEVGEIVALVLEAAR